MSLEFSIKLDDCKPLLGGISPANVRERVEAAGALRDMIDGYQVGELYP